MQEETAIVAEAQGNNSNSLMELANITANLTGSCRILAAVSINYQAKIILFGWHAAQVPDLMMIHSSQGEVEGGMEKMVV